jgi:hypothetical protein
MFKGARAAFQMLEKHLHNGAYMPLSRREAPNPNFQPPENTQLPSSKGILANFNFLDFES